MKILAGDIMTVVIQGMPQEFYRLLSLLEAVEWNRTLRESDKDVAADVGATLKEAMNLYDQGWSRLECIEPKDREKNGSPAQTCDAGEKEDGGREKGGK